MVCPHRSHRLETCLAVNPWCHELVLPTHRERRGAALAVAGAQGVVAPRGDGHGPEQAQPPASSVAWPEFRSAPSLTLRTAALLRSVSALEVDGAGVLTVLHRPVDCPAVSTALRRSPVVPFFKFLASEDPSSMALPSRTARCAAPVRGSSDGSRCSS